MARTGSAKAAKSTKRRTDARGEAKSTKTALSENGCSTTCSRKLYTRFSNQNLVEVYYLHFFCVRYVHPEYHDPKVWVTGDAQA